MTEAQAALDALRPGLPGIEIDARIFRPATFIENALRNMRSSLLLGAGLVAVVLFLFLLDLRTALISFAAIPDAVRGPGDHSVVGMDRGVAVSVAVVAVGTHYLLGLPWELAILIGAALNGLAAALALGGVPLMVRTVESLLQQRIDHVVSLDFEGFKGLTDALGGVGILLDEDGIGPGWHRRARCSCPVCCRPR